MLSRIAESFFWLGRYIERAEGTTRILSEHYQLIVEDQSNLSSHARLRQGPLVPESVRRFRQRQERPQLHQPGRTAR